MDPRRIGSTFGGVLGLWAMVTLYAWWITPPGGLSMVALAAPMLLAVTLAYALTFSYGFVRFYGLPLSDDWLRIPLGRLLMLCGAGVVVAVFAMFAMRWLTPAEVAGLDLAALGWEIGRFVLGPTLVALPVGYWVGASVSPEGDAGD